MQGDYSGDRSKPRVIAGWSNQELLSNLRDPIRATLGPDAYHLLFAEALARIMENQKAPETAQMRTWTDTELTAAERLDEILKLMENRSTAWAESFAKDKNTFSRGMASAYQEAVEIVRQGKELRRKDLEGS